MALEVEDGGRLLVHVLGELVVHVDLRLLSERGPVHARPACNVAADGARLDDDQISIAEHRQLAKGVGVLLYDTGSEVSAFCS